MIADSVQRPGLFAVVFERHFDAVHAYLARRVGTDRADDLASATFTTAFARRESFRRSSDSARPWLLGIATNLLRNEWRAEQRALEAVARLTADARELPSDVVSTASAAFLADGDGVVGLLGQLDADQRDVVLLRTWEGLSYQEIAVALEIPVGTVRSRLSRAHSRLRAALATDGEARAELTKEEVADDR